MSKKIYSRIITQDGGGQFIDRIQVEDVNGHPHVTAHSKIHTGGGLESCHPKLVTGVVSDLIAGKGEKPYTLEP